MLVTERRERILALTRDRGTASIGELAATLQVSEMTVRRDVDQLAEEGAVERIRGGVRARGLQRLVPAPAASAERRAIVAAAAGLVEPGMAVGISGGPTALALARELVRVPELTVVTNALPVSDLFSPPDRADAPYTQTVVLTGACARPRRRSSGRSPSAPSSICTATSCSSTPTASTSRPASRP